MPVPYADLHNPQSLNLYDYVGSDPTNHADADGHRFSWRFERFSCGLCGDTSADDDINNKRAQNTSDPTAPPPPPTPDPAGVRTDPSSNPEPSTNSNSSTTSSPADQTQAPMESRGRQGGQGKGERGDTSKPDKPAKGAKPAPGQPGRWLQWDGHKGNWVLKPPGWSPDTAKKVGIGAAIVTGAVITGHAVAGCFASGACELGLAVAF